MRYHGNMLITHRLPECSAFYTRLLGVEPSEGAGWAQFPLPDGTFIALHTPWHGDMQTEGGSQVMLLKVDSLATESERLADVGITCSEPHEIPGGAVVTITDPDGRTMQLLEIQPIEIQPPETQPPKRTT